MSIESPVSNEELEKAHAINSLVDAKILSRNSASIFGAEDIDRFAGYFQALREAPEIKMKKGRFEERDGYPSDECYVIARYGDQTEVSQVRILEHFEEEDVWENRLKKAGEKTKTISPHNDAITYKPGLEKKFEASIRGPMTVEEAMAKVEKTKASLIEIELKEVANHITVMKAIAQVAEDYKKNFEQYQRERIAEAVQAKQFIFDFMRQNKSADSAEVIKNLQGLVLKAGQEHGMHYVAAINFLVLALTEERFNRPGHDYGNEEMKEALYEPVGQLASIFGPQDSLRQ